MTFKERIKSEMMVIKSLGVVYGDIGTSPIYTLAIVLLLIKPTSDSIFQILSMIVWILTMLVTVQYAWLATSLSKRGEGGTVVLVQLLLPYGHLYIFGLNATKNFKCSLIPISQVPFLHNLLTHQ